MAFLCCCHAIQANKLCIGEVNSGDQIAKSLKIIRFWATAKETGEFIIVTFDIVRIN